MAKEDDRKGDGELDLKNRQVPKYEKPRMWRVIVLNDDFTPIEFVVQLICTIFRKTTEEAAAITLKVHNNGSATIAVYTYEIAETKTAHAMAAVHEFEYPLQLVMEPEE